MLALRPFSRAAERGADTLLWLVDSADVADEQGGYFVDRRRQPPAPAAHDTEAARRLWEVSEEQTRASARRPM